MAERLKEQVKGVLEFKDEDMVNGQVVGPVWINGVKEPKWMSKNDAQITAELLKMEFREV